MRLIDADAFLKSEIERCGCVPLIGSCTSDNEIFKFILERQPTIDAKEVVHGKWIDTQPEYHVGFRRNAHVCSNCNDYYTTEYDDLFFCPRCGANMQTLTE